MAMLLRRHDLVWLSSEGWAGLLREAEAAQDTQASACIAHWRAQRLPLVVGRQTLGDSALALGLAAPQAWDRRKIALRAPRGAVLYHDYFPKAAVIARLLPVALRKPWAQLCQALAARGVNARVHGSFGWERLAHMRYVTPHSDLDMLLPVGDAEMADSVAACLGAFDWTGPRLDGELLFPDGSAVAWREWLLWRHGAADRIMVKRLHGVVLERGLEWLDARSPVAA